MSSPALTLYHFPGACSRVSLCALEMAQFSYNVQLVNVLTRAQHEPAYRLLSPFGKIPVLLVDDQPLLENVGIINLVAALRPGAGIFPADPGPVMVGEIASGLSFCSGTLHPLVRGVTFPERVANGDGAGVREKSGELLQEALDFAERRLADREWWLGAPSIIDVYLDWLVFVAQFAHCDVSRFPHLCGLETRLAEIPGYRRMQEEEARFRAMFNI